jgi:hypothetical protein
MNQLHEMYLAAAVDARRASLTEQAHAARVARDARKARPSIGHHRRVLRWRLLLAHLRLKADEPRLSPVAHPV